MNELTIMVNVPGIKKKELCLFDFTGGLFKQYSEKQIEEMVDEHYRSFDSNHISITDMRNLYEELTNEARKTHRSKEWEITCHKYFEYYDRCLELGITPYSAEVWSAIKRQLNNKRNLYKKRVKEVKILSLLLMVIVISLNILFGGNPPDVYNIIDKNNTKSYITVEYQDTFICKSINSYNEQIAIRTIDDSIKYIETFYPETFQYYKYKDLKKEIRKINKCDIFGEFIDRKIVLPIIVYTPPTQEEVQMV